MIRRRAPFDQRALLGDVLRQDIENGADARHALQVGLRPHMDVVTHHTTVADDFAMTRSQWLIRGIDRGGKPTVVLTGGAALRLAAITPPGKRAHIDVSLTDEPPLAQAVVIITALPNG